MSSWALLLVDFPISRISAKIRVKTVPKSFSHALPLPLSLSRPDVRTGLEMDSCNGEHKVHETPNSYYLTFAEKHLLTPALNTQFKWCHLCDDFLTAHPPTQVHLSSVIL